MEFFGRAYDRFLDPLEEPPICQPCEDQWCLPEKCLCECHMDMDLFELMRREARGDG